MFGSCASFSAVWDARVAFLQYAKRSSIQALDLQPGYRGLDIGCGLGDEVRAMAELVSSGGMALGVDLSASLVAEARHRTPSGVPAEFHSADAHELPFEDSSFDAVRTERTFQHVRDPEVVIGEMLRVARTGARLALAEPDWDTLIVDATPLKVSRPVCRQCVDQTRNPDIGRRLRGLLAGAGVEDIALAPFTMVIPSLQLADHLFELSAGAATAEAAGKLEGGSAETWCAQLSARDDAGTFFAAMTGFIAVGRRP